ncbi:MAG TPA: PAS domain-containing protein, partial [Sphingomicrobium sp.]|nr:PAS domain-containing protein [Sphingomicrobium sp.]
MRPAEDADLTSLLEQVLDAAIELQGADFGDIQLYNADRNTLRIAAHRGVGQEFLDYFGCIDANDVSGCGIAAKEGRRVIIEDVTTYPPYAAHLGIAAATGYRGVSCTPLTERGTGLPLGMLTTLFREPYRLDEARLQLSDLFAGQAADQVSSRRDQQKLRESEEFFRLALEGGRMGTWEWDAETELIKADASHQAFFGMPPQNQPMPNEIYSVLMGPDEKGIGARCARDALEHGKDIQLELPIYPIDRPMRWIAVRGRARQNDSGSLIGISYDITERKERERALRENQEWLAAILDQVPGGVGLFDKDGHLVLRGGPLGKLWDDVLPSLDPASAKQWRGYYPDGGLIADRDYPAQRALRGEVVAPGLDFLHTDERGKDCWFRVSAAPFRDGDEIGGAVAFVQDVDKEKRAEERLRRSEEKLKSAVELAGLGLYSVQMVNGESHLNWDDRVRRMWGLPPGTQVNYQVWLDGIHPDDLARVEAAVAHAYDPAADGVYEAQYRVNGADGVERWVATRGETCFLEGRPVSFLGVALDIT